MYVTQHTNQCPS